MNELESFIAGELGYKSDEKTLQQLSDLKQFVAKHSEINNSEIVLITSGGTSVPLEKRTVRSLENFSTGTRGARLAEGYINRQIPVIFLTRDTSCSPFQNISDYYRLQKVLFCNSEDVSKCDLTSTSKDTAYSQHVPQIHQYVQVLERISTDLFTWTYSTLAEYLNSFYLILQVFNHKAKNLTIYSAAAVSDFYVPYYLQNDHKIQQSDRDSNELVLRMKSVPKFLSFFRKMVPDSLFVSFKLETDEEILTRKAEESLKQYNMDLVIANTLHGRYNDLKIVANSNIATIVKPADDTIENCIIDYIKNLPRTNGNRL